MSMGARFRRAARHLPAVVRPAIGFEFWSTLVFVLSLVPVTGWLLDRLVARSGQFAVTDHDLLSFLLSGPGVLFAVLGVGFALAFWFAEQAALLVIVFHALRGTKASVSRLLWENARLLPALVHLGLRQAVVYLAAALPFGAGVGLTCRLLLGEWDFYYYLNVRPGSWWLAVGIGGTLVSAYLALAAWLYVRWILSVPMLLVERLAPAEALRRSWEGTRGRCLELAGPLAVAWIVVLLAASALNGLIGLAAARLLGDADTLAVLIPLVIGTLALLALLDLGWFIVGKILHALLVAQAYVEHRGAEHAAVELAPITERPLPAGWRGLGWLAAVVALAGMTFATGSAVVRRVDAPRELDITGHRGSKRRAPENTLAALRQAIAEGADFAEIDVQTTADGVVVLLHDGDLMRVASLNRRLGETAYEQLRDVDVGSWFDPAFRDERVPTLQQAVDLARGRIHLNIELKYARADPELAGKVGRLVERNGIADRCVISSLNFDALAEVRRSFPAIRTGFIAFKAVGDLSRMEADFLSVSAARATPRLIRAVHRRGGAVHVWTVNDPGLALSMIELGVDNLITDEPELIRRLLDEWNGLSTAGKLALMLRNLIVGYEPPPPSGQ